jgi:MHS family proline/betaine transporter-like MFS transporter
MSVQASKPTPPPVCADTGLPLLPNGKVDTRKNGHGDHGDHVSAETRRKVVLAALAGNFVEWYEFAAYGVVAAFVAREFFSPDDPVAALLGVYAVFGLAFVARPIGGIIISRFGDTLGRKAVMSFCIVAMSLTTFGIGVLPSYAAIGIAAPLLLLLLRLLQGAAAGGEWSSAVSFVFEHSPATQRARWISYLAASTYPGLLGGVGLGSILALTLGQDDFQQWGWRILFLVALPLGGIGLYIRRRVDESPAFKAVQEEKAKIADKVSPLRDAFTEYRGTMLALFVITITYITGVYTNAALYVTFLISHDYSASQALNANLIGLALMTGGVLVFGPVSDKIGRKPTLIIGHLMLAATIFPMFWLPAQFGTMWAAMLGCGLFSLSIAFIGAPVLTSLPELFPAHVRATAGALPYNVATILAGFAPYIAIWLNDRFASVFAYPSYVVALAAVGLAGTVLLYRDPSRYSREELDQLRIQHRAAKAASKAPSTARV